MTFRVRLLVAAAAGAALVAGVLIWFQTTTGDQRPAVVADAPASPANSSAPVRDDWQTIEYRGAKVDVPARWKRLDNGDCEFQFEHWAPPGPHPCNFDGGVRFYGSATFDPAHGPGVRRTADGWAGYVYAGDYAVYASGADRELIQAVLNSARAT
ncbi:hypothetical protein ACIBSW_19075 [Actinoplanes sp. NPDC049668]|uniref:hypothetical protein n=1 Tax=unclassified Actinoplanes TaxID=2626549 RepID=UPI0033A72022